MVAGDTPMKIIAFDLGSTIGWATNYAHLNTGHKTFIGSRVERLAAIQGWLHDFNWHMVEIAVYETPLVRGQAATRILWGIAALIEAAVTRANLPVIDVAVPTIKKFAAGKGFASKLEMQAAARKFGYTGSDEHEADAVCLLKYAVANLEAVSR
jgi:Holliday junction resolvasome RuvABC endonuclease subunit